MNVHKAEESNFSQPEEKKLFFLTHRSHSKCAHFSFFKAREYVTARTALRVHPLERVVYHLVSGFILPVEQICQHDTGY